MLDRPSCSEAGQHSPNQGSGYIGISLKAQTERINGLLEGYLRHFSANKKEWSCWMSFHFRDRRIIAINALVKQTQKKKDVKL
ncbi:hypothetical protein PVK06_043622 [Gossypium arboreum]|uniref:Transposase n=1 Tax=Gossypium arboreum TaxID=29729 RepID=A0ABR0MQZ2_GOSAR|nr:hypothetical protein PVK06_043622 [Gossypium arboreum]